MSLNPTDNIEPTDFSAYAATPFNTSIIDTNSSKSGTFHFSASDWALNGTIYTYDSQSNEQQMQYASLQNKIILIKWGGTYVKVPYYEYGVWKAANEYQESGIMAMTFKTICPYSSYCLVVADYHIKEQSLGADRGYGFKVIRSDVKRINYGTSTTRWVTSTLSSTYLYPMEISFLSPNVFPTF